MFKLKNLPLTISLIIVIGLVVGWGISMVLAWTNPTANPPSNNVAAPINVSGTEQYKTGKAGFATDGIDTNYGLTVGNNTNKLGIKTDGDSWFGSNLTVSGKIIVSTGNDGVTIGSGSGITEILFDSGTDWNTGTGWSSSIYGADAFYFYAGGERMSVDNDGDVWIGNNLRVAGLTNCDTIDTDASGNLSCGTDANTTYNYPPDSCAAGSSIRVINADGTVICETDDVGAGGGGDGYLPDDPATSGVDMNTYSITNAANIKANNYMYAQAFYDKNDTSYVLDPNATSKMKNLNLTGNLDIDGTLNVDGQAAFWKDISVDDAIKAKTLEATGTIYTSGGMHAKGDIQADGKLYGFLARKECKTYTTTGGDCPDGWFAGGIAKISGEYYPRCCRAGGSGTPTNPGGSNPDDPGCFTGDTKILMADGSSKKIKDIKAGEYILTRKFPDSDELVKARVKRSVSYDGWDGYLVINNKLKATTNHVIYVNGEWKEAGEIKIGDRLVNEKGEKIVVKSLEKVDKAVTVYNIEIEGYKTYFANGIYVHNLAKPL